MTERFRSDAFATYAANGFLFASGYANVYVVNRFLGTETYGSVAILTSSVALLTQVTTANTADVVTLFFAKNREDPNRAAQFVALGFITDLALVSLNLAIFLGASSWIAENLLKDPNSAGAVQLFSVVMTASLCRSTLLGFLQAVGSFRAINAARVLENVLRPLGTAILAFALPDLLNMHVLVGIYGLASCCATFVLVAGYRAHSERPTSLSITAEAFRLYRGLAAKMFTSSLVKSASTSLDSILLGYFVNPTTVGVYTALNRLLWPITYLAQPLHMLTLSRATSLLTHAQHARYFRMIGRITATVLAGGAAVVVGMLLFLRKIVELLHVSWTPDASAAFALLSMLTLLGALAWWTRGFMMFYRPALPILTNALLSLNTLGALWLFLSSDMVSPLVGVSAAKLIAFLPSFLWGMIAIYRIQKGKRDATSGASAAA